MSVLAKGMKMPRTCNECPCYRRDSFNCMNAFQCNLTLKVTNWGLTERPSDCPLVEVKTPHGRLIDEDEAKEHFYTCETNGRPLHAMELSERLACFDEVPTVIEAEGET